MLLRGSIPFLWYTQLLEDPGRIGEWESRKSEHTGRRTRGPGGAGETRGNIRMQVPEANGRGQGFLNRMDL